VQFDTNACPQWLHVTKSLEPFWIVANPKKSPIFEISGFEFSESKAHTATDRNGKGFSIRFPRVTKQRADKRWKDATNLEELRDLIETSRNDPAACLNVDGLAKNKKKRKRNGNGNDENDNDAEQNDAKKRKLQSAEDEDVKMNDVDCDDDNIRPSPPLDGNLQNMNDDRVICRYDAQCYRKNVDHFKEYRHPQKEEAEIKKVKAECMRKMEEIKLRQDEFVKAAQINKDKQLMDAKQTYEELQNDAEEKYKILLDKAQKEFDENVVPIKQKEQFELEKIDKKYHT